MLDNDLARVLGDPDSEGDYYLRVCTSRWLVQWRRRFAPWTLRYETRHEPPYPAGLLLPRFTLYPAATTPSAPGGSDDTAKARV